MRSRMTVLALLIFTLTPTAAQASTGWARWDHDTYIRWHSHISRPTDDHVASWLRYNQARHRAVLRARHAHKAWMEQQRAVEAQRGSQAQERAPSQGGGYHGSIPNLIRSVWGSASGCALAIAWRESRFNPRAYNPSGAAGLFQLMPIWYNGRWHFDPFNAWLNVHYAHEMYLDFGFGPWGGC